MKISFQLSPLLIWFISITVGVVGLWVFVSVMLQTASDSVARFIKEGVAEHGETHTESHSSTHEPSPEKPVEASHAEETSQEPESPSTLHTNREESWAYAGSQGPLQWQVSHKNCGNLGTQSPVDITIPDRKSLPAEEVPRFRYGPTKSIITLWQQTIVIEFHYGSYADMGDRHFALKRAFFRTPSEHSFGGIPYEMEVQLEHRSPDGSPLFVSFFIEKGSEHPLIEHVVAKLPANAQDRQELAALDPKMLLPSHLVWVHYEGSLTFPPCSEPVPWWILTNPIKASPRQIDRFVSRQQLNIRPLQAKGKRKVYRITPVEGI